MKLASPRWWWWLLQGGNDESFCVLVEKIKVGVFRSCLQRTKNVIFEGLVTRFGYAVGGERKKKMEKKK